MIRKSSLLLIVILSGCGTSKQTSQLLVLPDWVQKKPVSTLYYNGIGSAPKNGAVVDYQGKAKAKALADLSSEITVTISSKSVFHQFESSLGYSEDFASTIKSESKEDLEGYELVQNFETADQYFVWYRLSKEGFQKIKEQRKQAAISKALDYYSKAQEAKSGNRYFESITNYIKGLESVKPYLSDELEVTYQNKPVYLGNDLFTGLLSVVNDIKIIPNQPELLVKNGMPIEDEKLKFRCLNGSNQVLAGIPIVFTLGQRPLLNNTAETNLAGTVSFLVNKFSNPNQTEYFEASVDFANKASQITTDPVFRKMLRKLDSPKGQILLHVTNPSFYVVTKEQNLGKEITLKIGEPKLKQLLTQHGFPVAVTKEQADFILELNCNTAETSKIDRIFYTQLNGEIKILDAQQKPVLIKPIEGIQGAQLNYKEAGMDAYLNLSEYLSKNLIIKLEELVK